VRSRKGIGNNDFDRARRQQQVLLALRQKLDDPDILLRLPEVLAAVSKVVQTDLPPEMVEPMMDLARRTEGARVKSVVLGPLTFASQIPPDRIDGLYALKLDLARVAELSRQVFGDESLYSRPGAGPPDVPLIGPGD
jgi:anionic cell wall polymer biosynthesis LytR-Cps2A-Psr (LCP) family protein